MATQNALNLGLAGSTGTGSFVGSTSATLVTPVLGAASATSIAFSSTSGVIGTTTNNNAAAGSVGEYVDSGTVTGTYTVSNTVYNAASISLTAGDWDVYISLFPNFSSYNGSGVTISISTTSATIVTQIMGNSTQGTVGLGGTSQACGNISSFAYKRLSLASTTTTYLCTNATWSGGAAPEFSGQIVARRVR